ncbi:hypothetical protein [Leptolyngbya sp. PCC 6406]|uniref:hypothetical protein n=1 Tax=Leptolyngbya sp. PCC 6406 TaxID=1173264 RepID=UPI0002ACB468|nr:hypothetical protein [Leptolyngbya sp. PCC 6406]
MFSLRWIVLGLPAMAPLGQSLTIALWSPPGQATEITPAHALTFGVTPAQAAPEPSALAPIAIPAHAAFPVDSPGVESPGTAPADPNLSFLLPAPVPGRLGAVAQRSEPRHPSLGAIEPIAQPEALIPPQAHVPLPVPPAEVPGSPQTEVPPPPMSFPVAVLFAGGSESLVARAVGSAEGTRTAEGHRTPAYFGHVDPGNQVWNLGSFSYQHGAQTPEEADQRQLDRLQHQTQVLRHQAAAKGLTLSVLEILNGIDLANQAPLAALDRGYIDWLDQARRLNLGEAEGILWARSRAFLDPDTGRWNAPGLGNSVESISQDQERRQQAIASALRVYQAQVESLPSDVAPALSTGESTGEPMGEKTGLEPIDQVILQDWPL